MLTLNRDLTTARLHWRVILNHGSPWEYGTNDQLKRIGGDWRLAGVIQFEEKANPQQNPAQLAHALKRAESALRHLIDIPEQIEIQLKDVILAKPSVDRYLG